MPKLLHSLSLTTVTLPIFALRRLAKIASLRVVSSVSVCYIASNSVATAVAARDIESPGVDYDLVVFYAPLLMPYAASPRSLSYGAPLWSSPYTAQHFLTPLPSLTLWRREIRESV